MEHDSYTAVPMPIKPIFGFFRNCSKWAAISVVVVIYLFIYVVVVIVIVES